MKRLMIMLAVLTATVYVACKQQEGDRCQVNEDCESGVCNQSKGTCGTEGAGSDDDADIPNIDATPGDAVEDAPIDAAPVG